jgi:olfactory receptor
MQLLAQIFYYIFTKAFLQFFNNMEARKKTPISKFLLLGLTENPELQFSIFILFLSMYLVSILGNLLIVRAVSCDSHLHTPMYFFLSNLSSMTSV